MIAEDRAGEHGARANDQITVIAGRERVRERNRERGNNRHCAVGSSGRKRNDRGKDKNEGRKQEGGRFVGKRADKEFRGPQPVFANARGKRPRQNENDKRKDERLYAVEPCADRFGRARPFRQNAHNKGDDSGQQRGLKDRDRGVGGAENIANGRGGNMLERCDLAGVARFENRRAPGRIEESERGKDENQERNERGDEI